MLVESLETSTRTRKRPALPGVPGTATCSTWLAVIAVALAGCTATTRESGSTAAPPLQLLDTGPLELPPDCAPERGAVYRTRFVVRPDGVVHTARSESGDGCVQQALQRWVTSFRYAPLPEATPAVFDWLAVTASRS